MSSAYFQEMPQLILIFIFSRILYTYTIITSRSLYKYCETCTAYYYTSASRQERSLRCRKYVGIDNESSARQLSNRGTESFMRNRSDPALHSPGYIYTCTWDSLNPLIRKQWSQSRETLIYSVCSRTM